MTQKYELVYYGEFIFNIKALIDIPRHGVKAGDLGGFVNGEHNLSQEGDCWIEKGSTVRHKAHVSGNVFVRNGSIIAGNARVSGNAIIDDCAIGGNSIIKDDVVLTGSSVFGESVVRGNARIQCLSVTGNCVLLGNTEIIIPGIYRYTVMNLQGEITQKDYFFQGPALSSGRRSFAYRRHDGSVSATTGCFHGTLDEYLIAIEETHKDNPEHLAEYRRFHKNFVEFFNA